MSSSLSLATHTSKPEWPKITILYDNRKANAELKEGFGFSCFIEWNGRKILFDTGGKINAFFDNAEKLKVPLEKVTSVVFSHHHWDHTAGIEQVLNRVPLLTKVYLPDPFSSTLEGKIPHQVQVKKVAEFEKIDEEVYLLVQSGGYWLSTIYEQAILLKTPKGVVIVTGCAHPGIINIIQETQKRLGKVHMVIGGFHLHHKWSCSSAKIVKKFQELGVEKVAPCHCAGDTAIAQFEEAYKVNFLRIGTGSVIEV